MVQDISAQLLSLQQFNNTLGYSLSIEEFKPCLQQVKFINPKVGKFWQGTDAQAGIYIAIAGKVRLLDSADELIATLEAGDSFGEFTLFKEGDFKSYAARASVNLQLGFVPGEVLWPLMAKYPQIRQHLWAKALSRNPQQVDSDNPPVMPSDSKRQHETKVLSTPAVEQREKKISKAYFPNSTQRVGHLLQRVIRRYPFFAQQSGSDCGAACLVMVSRYWGKNFSVNRLRDIANVDRNGSSLRGLSAAAESIGFATRPVKASLDQLAKQKLPAIAHWEGKHYIVVYEITPKQVIVADPGIGQRSLSHAEFKANWTGYTLLLQPTAWLKDAKEATTPFWQFFELMKPHTLVMLEVFVASLFIQIFGLVTPLFTQLILDRVVVQRSELTLTAVGLGLLIFSLFRVAMTGLRQYLLDHTANKIDLALIVGFIRHTLRLPLSYFESRYVGDIISRVQENRKIQRFLSGEALSILLDLVTVFIYLGLMFWYSWKMALLVLVIVPPFFLLALIATPFLQKISREIFNAVANESSYLIEALSGVRTVKSTAVEQSEEILREQTPARATDDWADATKDLLDSLPQVWTRGLLYFLVVFVSIILPWAMLSKVDETGTARGRLEPKGKTVRLDAAVAGTVAEIRVKEGDSVKVGQTLLVLESELVKAEMRQAQDKLEGQLNRLSQLNSSKSQLVVSLTTQDQQNQSQQLEKQAQIDQARQNMNALRNSYDLQKDEKLAQVNQARQTFEHSQTANKLVNSSLASTEREVERYRSLWQSGVVPEINVVQKQDIAKDKQQLSEQNKSDIQQAKLRLVEQQSSYERTIRQANADIEQALLRLKEQERSYQTLTRSSKLAMLKIDEQQKNLETEITTLQAEIAQNKSQIVSLKFQLGQRELRATVNGRVFQLPIQRAGSVVQPGTMIAEIAPQGSPLIIRAQMATTESGFLRRGLPVKLKFDAYPFQDYGVLEGELLEISPTTIEVDTPNGKVAAYDLEIALKQNCIPSANKCIALHPGDTATAEVIVRQRRIIDFLLDPFKQLQQGGVKL